MKRAIVITTLLLFLPALVSAQTIPTKAELIANLYAQIVRLEAEIAQIGEANAKSTDVVGTPLLTIRTGNVTPTDPQPNGIQLEPSVAPSPFICPTPAPPYPYVGRKNITASITDPTLVTATTLGVCAN